MSSVMRITYTLFKKDSFMLKRLFHIMLLVFAAFFCAGGLLSCTKEQPVIKTKVSFTVYPETATKAALTEAGESRIASLDLLVFRASDGMLDAYVRSVAEGSESLTQLEASVTSGVEMHWYVIANIPAGRLSSFSSESDFLSASTSLTDMSGGTMVMHASGIYTFNPGTNLIENVSLIRYACKVSVKNILVSWLGTFDTAPSCTLDEIVLVNVRGDVDYSTQLSASASDLWYNKSSVETHTAFIDACLDWKGSTVVTGPESVNVGVSLYAMPNALETDAYGPVSVTSPWTPRRTRIALKLTIGGQPQWYPIDLPSMAEKTHYIASDVTIMGPGTSGPDEPIERTSIDFTVNVYAWGEEDGGEVVFPSVEQEG